MSCLFPFSFSAPPAVIADCLEQPVAVLGAGVSGCGVIAFLERIGATGVLYDEDAPGANPMFDTRCVTQHLLVVFSPGFSPEHPWLVTSRMAGCLCLGELDFSSLFWPGELIAVTGTNGKTTLTKFLAHALSRIGWSARATGNIGYPLSRLVLEKSDSRPLAVCEVSSFQAETLHYLRPSSTLFTNFAEDHLERHAGLDSYFAAKWRLVELTPNERVFVGSSVGRWLQNHGTSLPLGCFVTTESQPMDQRLRGSVFMSYPQRENFILMAAWWRQTGLSEELLYEAAHTFQLSQHQLAQIGKRKEVSFWNDSKATNFHAVRAALAQFPQPVFLIAGGKGKGGDAGTFVGQIASKVRYAFLIGEAKQLLAGLCRTSGVSASCCDTLEVAVQSAFNQARPGDQILFSPGFASFDMFQNYADRGRQFESIVENL